MTRALIALVLVAAAMFGLGYLGHLHPAFDAIALGRRVAGAAILGLLALLSVMHRRVFTGVALVVVLAISVLWARSGFSDGPGGLRLYTKNLWYALPSPEAVVSDVIQTAPDIVVLQEVSDQNVAQVMGPLAQGWPYHARCPWQGWNGVAVLSKWPLVDGSIRCSGERSLLAVRVDRPDAPLWVVGVHLQQPWPDVQWQHLELALPVLEGLAGDIVVAGDFNTVPWSAAARKIGRLTGTRHIPPPKSTFRLRGVGLPLDQVWAADGTVATRPALGSDHLGVLADVWPARP